MQNERAKDDVVGRAVAPIPNVAMVESDFRIIRAQPLCDFQRRFLTVDRIDGNGGADFAAVLRHQSRNIARSGGQIEDAKGLSRHDPLLAENADQIVAAEKAIELADVVEILFELRRQQAAADP